MPVECPTCHSPLNATDTVCNVCLRGRTRQEIFRSVRKVSQEEKKERQRPYFIAGAVLLTVAAGFGAYTYPKWAPAAAPPAPPPTAAAVPAAQIPVAAAPTPEALPPAPPTATAAPTPAPAPYSTALPEKYHRKAKGSPSKTSLSDSSGAEEAPENQWTINGRVYELLSLKGVAGARLTFTDKNDGHAFKSVTKADGSYKIALPRMQDGGYEVTVSHKDHRPDYLDEMEPAYDHQSRSRRLEAAQMLAQTGMLHVPLLPPEKGSTLEYNIILVTR